MGGTGSGGAVRRSRRGSILMSYEAIMGLLILVLFCYAAFSYVSAKANGELYFSRFYAKDLASTADIVNAGAGDVTLRYDNLKPNLDLSFRFTGRTVSVGATGESAAGAQALDQRGIGTAKIGDTLAAELTSAGGTTEFYGAASNYEGKEVLVRPSFIVLKKTDGVFGFNDMDVAVVGCPAGQRSIPSSEAAVFFDVGGSVTQEEAAALQQSFMKSLAQSSLSLSPTKEKANILLHLDIVSGERNEISFQPTDDDGKALSCRFIQQLTSRTIVPFTVVDGQTGGNAFALSATVMKRNDITLKNEQIVQSLAHALVAYYAPGPKQDAEVTE